MRRVLLAAAVAALAIPLAVVSIGAQKPQTSLAGVVDVHAHSHPDSIERSIDAIALARLARESGMRGIVLKNHNEPTASLAYVVRKEVPGIEVFGGIVLNRAVGGINPAAVEQMARVAGGWGRVVWLPTAESENQVRFEKADRPFVPIARGGQLLPETREVLRIVAARGLTLATGHSSPEESLLVIREARAAGVQRIVVTHPRFPSIRMSVEQMKQAASQGAFLELVYGGVVQVPPTATLEDYVATVRAVGPAHVILSSDLGQPGRPLHPDGLRQFMDRMGEQGFAPDALALMMKTNPARLLGLQ